MPANQLHISIIQPDIVWENKEANLIQYESFINGIEQRKHIIILPEMFTTGFSMQPRLLAETMEGPSVQWMKGMAAKHRCIITGSLIIEENGHYYNRLVWMQPDGQYGCYDKRHLFAYAEENQHYEPGNKRLIVSVSGWKICPMVCYDLRFPVWIRNQHAEYDVLVFVANWPERRIAAWNTLLQARAIENQSYVIGVNRVGTDGKGIFYNGDSRVFDPMGTSLWQAPPEACVHSFVLEKELVTNMRQHLPFLNDADHFMIL